MFAEQWDGRQLKSVPILTNAILTEARITGHENRILEFERVVDLVALVESSLIQFLDAIEQQLGDCLRILGGGLLVDHEQS